MTRMEMAQQRLDARLPLDDSIREREFERACFRMGMWTVNELQQKAGPHAEALTEILDEIAWEVVNADD